MALLTALSLTIGIIGGLLTYLALGPAAGSGVQIWAVFLAAACYFHCGGKEAGLRTTITQTLFGVLMAWIALMLIVTVPVGASIGVPAWAGICVAATVIVFVLAANSPALAVIPATVYGYASTAAFALLATKLDTLTSVSMTNPALAAGVSLVIGAFYGYVCEKLAIAMTAKPAMSQQA